MEFNNLSSCEAVACKNIFLGWKSSYQDNLSAILLLTTRQISLITSAPIYLNLNIIIMEKC